MDIITNNMKTFNLISKNICIFCQKKYIIEYDYQHSDKLCIICYNNYKELMFQDNDDYVEIV